MGKSLTREDGLMIDSSAIAVDSSGHSLEDAFIHMSVILDDTTAATSGYTKTINDTRINEHMRVINADFTNPINLLTDVSWTTANGYVTFAYDITASKTTTMEFDLVQFKI